MIHRGRRRGHRRRSRWTAGTSTWRWPAISRPPPSRRCVRCSPTTPRPAIGNLPTPDTQLTDELNTAYEDGAAAGEELLPGASGNPALLRRSAAERRQLVPLMSVALARMNGSSGTRPPPPPPPRPPTTTRSVDRRPLAPASGRGPDHPGREVVGATGRRRRRALSARPRPRRVRPAPPAGPVVAAHRTVRGRQPIRRSPQPDDGQLGDAGRHLAEVGGGGGGARLGHPAAHRGGRGVLGERRCPGPIGRWYADSSSRSTWWSWTPCGAAISMQGEPVHEVAGGLPCLSAAVAWLACEVRRAFGGTA